MQQQAINNNRTTQQQQQQQHGLSLTINQCQRVQQNSGSSSGGGGGNTNNGSPFANMPHRIMDLFSLSVVTYLKFCGLSYEVISHEIDANSLLQPKMMSHATSPTLYRHDKSVAMGPYQCLHYLKEHGVNLDVHLNVPDTSSISIQQILSEIDIFVNLMSEKLYPLYVWQMWGLSSDVDYQNVIWNGWFQNVSHHLALYSDCMSIVFFMFILFDLNRLS